ncbi:helix-turn-helix transcriptional regulator [Jiangella anatolica]|uniref:helix-turn-helix transcriptional regulator n=1 Tax=Jiangella anatolica TaxID=2670374 RepID=UPI001314469A|nr:WYL domain-containing protein [Jiangella anatolica]
MKRLIEDLNGAGWDIRNEAPAGQTAVYRVFAGDNRLRLALTPEQQAELSRAALIAGDTAFAERAGLEGDGDVPPVPELRTVPPSGHDDALDKVLYALERHCRLRFVYKRRPRVVHPHFVYPGTAGWHLVGHEQGSDRTKQFVTDRMSDVRVDLPRTADARHEPYRDELDPLAWTIDEAVDVTVETTPAHRNQVETLLGTPSYHEVDDDVVRLTIRVTHRAAFRNRVYELGPRVRVLGPESIRSELLRELESLLD